MSERLIRPSDPKQVALVFEALLRQLGGGIKMPQHLLNNLRGEIFINELNSGVLQARTMDLAEERWNPAIPIQSILTDDEVEAYARRLVSIGPGVSIVLDSSSLRLKNIVRQEIDDIFAEAEALERQRRYLEALQKDDEEDEQRKAQATTQSAIKRQKPRGVRRA